MARRLTDRDLARLDLAGVIYGIILATALIGAFSEQPKVGQVATFAAVLGSAVIFWLAHAYAHILAAGVVDREPITGPAVREALIRQLPLVFGALPPALVLLAEPLGILSEDNSDNIAMLVGVGLLTLFGFVAARRRGAGALGTVVLTAISAGLGLVMIGLKSAVH